MKLKNKMEIKRKTILDSEKYPAFMYVALLIVSLLVLFSFVNLFEKESIIEKEITSITGLASQEQTKLDKEDIAFYSILIILIILLIVIGIKFLKILKSEKSKKKKLCVFMGIFVVLILIISSFTGLIKEQKNIKETIFSPLTTFAIQEQLNVSKEITVFIAILLTLFLLIILIIIKYIKIKTKEQKK